VADDRIGSHGVTSRAIRSGALRLTFCSGALGSLTASYGGASTWVIGIDILSTRGRKRLAAAAKAHRQCPGCAATAPRQCSGTSNEGLSKIARRRQIVKTGVSPPVATICGGETSCVGATDWAAIEATDRMVRVSQAPLLPMQHITPVLRGAATPLATAGGVVSLRERRWKPLRRPCGRLSGLRKTLNVIRNAP
jgi:hypothetical protein